jgi:transposase
MREDDGRKLDHQTLEAIRLRAVEQVARGVPAAEVGAGLAALGLHRRTIYTWLAKERTEGRQALRARPVPGRRRKLTDAQLGELAALITDTDPRDHGFAVALWTREIIRQLIAARFGVALTVASVGRTLHGLGFSAQRPLYRAEQADPAAVARWKEVEYPAIAAAAKAAGGTVFFVDEAGVRSDYHAGTTWARWARRRRCAPPAPGSPSP